MSDQSKHTDDDLFAEFRKLTPGERLALRMSAKADSKKAKRAKRGRVAESEAAEQIRRSWKDVEPSLKIQRAIGLSGIGERELRRLIADGSLYASQDKPGARGSTLRISKASLVDYLCATVR